MRNWKRKRQFLGLLAIFFVVVTFFPGIFFPWSRLNNREEDIELHSGRLRVTYHFLHIPYKRAFSDTPFSLVLSGAGTPEEKDEMWGRVNTFSPGMRNSPYHAYHGAFSQMRMMETTWEFGSFSPEARVKSARQILQAYRENGSRFGGDPIADALWKMAMEALDAGRTVEVADIPDLPDYRFADWRQVN